MKRHKHGDDRDNFLASIVSSRALEEEIASPAELAHKCSTSSTRLSRTLMASPQHLVSMESLPDELLINIFIRLLAKQLTQMRSVSKSWNSLLSQASFIKSHLSMHINDQILLIFHETSIFKPFTVKPTQSPHLELTNFIKLPVNPRPRLGFENGFRVIGSINGLICSCYGDSLIHIWNPSLSAVLTLPPSSLPSSTVPHGYGSTKIYFRFGFDPKTDDHKVVKLTGIASPPKYIDIWWWLQVEIYSMRKGSWEITEGVPTHNITWICGGHLLRDGYDGRLHWLGCTNEEADSERILAFDLGSETFREIPLPPSTLDYETLGVVAGTLCVILGGGDVVGFEVWVMDEYGVADSWVKRHFFSQFINESRPLGFTSHNEFAIEDSSGCLVLYDPSTNKQKILEDYSQQYCGLDKVVEYVDSLVWVAPAAL